MESLEHELVVASVISEGFPPAILWMTCCSVMELLLPELLLLKIPRILLGWELTEVLPGLLDMETIPESLLSEILELLASAPSESDFSLAGITGLTPSRDFSTVEDCSVSSASFVRLSSLIFFGVDVVLLLC